MTAAAEARLVHPDPVGDVRDLALFNMAINSKLRGRDLVRLQVRDVFVAGQVRERASVNQQKTGHPVRFKITETTHTCLKQWIGSPGMPRMQYLWPTRSHDRPHMSTRQYARLLHEWVSSIGLEVSSYRTHSMRQTKVAHIYKKTGNLRAVQLLLGHTKMDSTVRCLEIKVDDALAISGAIHL